MVGYGTCPANYKVTGLAEICNETIGFSFRDFVTKMRDEVANEFRTVPRAFCGWLAEMFQHLGLPFVHGRSCNLGLRLGFWFWSGSDWD